MPRKLKFCLRCYQREKRSRIKEKQSVNSDNHTGKTNNCCIAFLVAIVAFSCFSSWMNIMCFNMYIATYV